MTKRKRKQHATEMTDEEIVREVFPPKALEQLREAAGDVTDPTPDAPAPRSKSIKKEPK